MNVQLNSNSLNLTKLEINKSSLNITEFDSTHSITTLFENINNI